MNSSIAYIAPVNLPTPSTPPVRRSWQPEGILDTVELAGELSFDGTPLAGHRSESNISPVSALENPVSAAQIAPAPSPIVDAQGRYHYRSRPSVEQLPPYLQVSMAALGCASLTDLLGPDPCGSTTRLVGLQFHPEASLRNHSLTVTATYADQAGAHMKHRVKLAREAGEFTRKERIKLEASQESGLRQLSPALADLARRVSGRSDDPMDSVRHWLEGPEQIGQPLRSLTWEAVRTGSTSKITAEANYSGPEADVKRHLSMESLEDKPGHESIEWQSAQPPQRGSAAARATERLGGVDPARYFEELFPGGPLRPAGLILGASQNQGDRQAQFNFQITRDGSRIGEMGRVFDRPRQGEAYVHHDLFTLRKECQGAHVAKTLLARSLPFYESCGFHKVELFAALQVGGYAWARYGFTPRDECEMTRLAGVVHSRLERLPLGEDVKAGVFRLLENPDPRTLWALSDLELPVKVDGKSTTLGKALLLGVSWDGVLNLQDPEARDRFNRYVSEKPHGKGESR